MNSLYSRTLFEIECNSISQIFNPTILKTVFPPVGPKTVNGKPSEWGPWSECSAEKCGTYGTRQRTRSCVAPVFGGHPCPTKGVSYSEREKCAFACKKACNPATWEAFTFQCCTPDSPCYAGEGDCDRDEDCVGDLVCRRKNCGEGFKKRYSGNRPACCGMP